MLEGVVVAGGVADGVVVGVVLADGVVPDGVVADGVVTDGVVDEGVVADGVVADGVVARVLDGVLVSPNGVVVLECDVGVSVGVVVDDKDVGDDTLHGPAMASEARAEARRNERTRRRAIFKVSVIRTANKLQHMTKPRGKVGKQLLKKSLVAHAGDPIIKNNQPTGVIPCF